MAPNGLLTKKDNSAVPLRAVKVDAMVRGYSAQVDCSLEYENTEKQPIEAIFTFPLDSSSAVVDFVATIDGRKIKGQVQEKQKAKETYDDALAGGRSAFLLESERQDIFTVSVGNLPPSKKATVTLTFVSELHTEHDGSVRFHLPSVLTPRYSRPGEQNPTENVTYLPASAIPYTFSFNMGIQADVDKVESASHKLKVDTTVDDEGLQVALVTLAEEHKFDKDLVLTITPSSCHQPHAIVEAGSTHEEDPPFLTNPAVSLNYFPDFSSAEVLSELIFVIDRSGSMSGEYIQAAKETLTLFLKSIPDGCYFNIVGFGSRYQLLFPDSVPYNQTHLDKASQHTESIQADMGGTELLEPLQKIFSMTTREGLPKQVFVLTDGAVSNLGAVISEVKKNVHVARSFAVGIGSGASTELVKGIATSGNGSSEFIQSGERMQPKVMRMLKRALSPSISDVHVTWSVSDDARVIQTPRKVPPVFSGDRLIIYGFVNSPKQPLLGRQDCSATLKGVIGGSPFQHTVSFSLDSSHGISPSTTKAVHQLATKSLICDLQLENVSEDEVKVLAASSVKCGENAPESKENLIVQLSTASSVVCEQTSFVAVDEANGEPVEGSMAVRQVPVAKRSHRGSQMHMRMLCSSMPSGRSLGRSVSGRSSGSLCSAPPPPPPQLMLYGDSCPDAAPLREQSDSTGFALTSAFQNPVVSKASNSSQSPLLSSMLAIVSWQKASGAWPLSNETAQLMNMSLTDLEMYSPFSPPLSEGQSSIWVTAVIVAWLELKCSGYVDEWELLADKARKWLKKQALPEGMTSDTLMLAAREVFSKVMC